MEHTEHTGKLAFLDTLITVHPSGTYSTELYFKPMTAPIILHYTSAHPKSTKKAVLNAEIQRIIGPAYKRTQPVHCKTAFRGERLSA